jgi:uncharacterized damage-inducible protein DinB
MTIERTEPPLATDERTTLDAYLDYHRATLLWKCEGLTDGQLRQRAVPPSTLSLLGLVRHLTQIERGWFREDAANPMPDIYSTDDRPDADFDDVEQADVPANLAAYRKEVEACRAAVAGLPLDHLIKGRTREYSLRWIYLHMIEEYARHNGHADLIRERIDGATGD